MFNRSSYLVLGAAFLTTVLYAGEVDPDKKKQTEIGALVSQLDTLQETIEEAQTFLSARTEPVEATKVEPEAAATAQATQVKEQATPQPAAPFEKRVGEIASARPEDGT